MKNIDEELFLKGLKSDRVNKMNELIEKNNIVSIYEMIQIYGSIIFIIGFLIYYFFEAGNLNMHNLLKSYEFFFATIMLFIYNIALEKATKPLKKEREKIKENLKNSMILRVCNCKDYCKCKDELNDYMKKRGIKII